MFFVTAALGSWPAPEEEPLCSVPTRLGSCGQLQWELPAPSPVVGFTINPGREPVGHVLRTDSLPMPADELLLHFAGLRMGADGQAWLSGGPLTVMLDGVSLGEMDVMSSDRRATPRTEVPRSILHRLP